MLDEIEELWALANECREWARTWKSDSQTSREFLRVADKLDEIANRLAARMPT